MTTSKTPPADGISVKSEMSCSNSSSNRSVRPTALGAYPHWEQYSMETFMINRVYLPNFVT